MSERDPCQVCGCPVANADDWFNCKGGERPDLCWEPGEALCRSVGESQPTYNPSTHRLVPKDAVVLERSVAQAAIAHLEACAETDRENGFEPASYDAATLFRLRSALAAAERSPDTGEGG